MFRGGSPDCGLWSRGGIVWEAFVPCIVGCNEMETAQQGSGSVCLAFKRHAREAGREGSNFRVLSAACAFPATGPPVEVGVTAVCE